ncbi:hypothetical protein SK128_021514 [Halocaridina rubra]|uniref:Uncharacterized protein n=1 Tax=Halocaridina rubra TaxID=373956 RepID=A0AAN8WER4_HALRR
MNNTDILSLCNGYHVGHHPPPLGALEDTFTHIYTQSVEAQTTHPVQILVYCHTSTLPQWESPPLLEIALQLYYSIPPWSISSPKSPINIPTMPQRLCYYLAAARQLDIRKSSNSSVMHFASFLFNFLQIPK